MEYRSRSTRETIRVSFMCSTGAIITEWDFEGVGLMEEGWRSLSFTTVGSS